MSGNFDVRDAFGSFCRDGEPIMPRLKRCSWLSVVLAGWSVVVVPRPCPAQTVDTATPSRSHSADDVLGDLRWRELGPAVFGGRITAIAAGEQATDTIYIGAASGGVWRSTDGGIRFKPIFDHVGPMSIGSLALCQSDPSIVWVGTGEPNNRQNSSWGGGVFKSTDAGDSWTSAALPDTHHIGPIAIDPRDCNVVYVAAVGHLWGPNEERGLYKTADGGKTWTRVLYIDRDTGVVDVKLDPQSPDTLYAAAHQRQRAAFGYNGGGPHSALYKSVDGGATWKKLVNGLPYADGGDTGRIGIAIYRKDPRIVYVEVEHANGGLYRSDDRGETWLKMSRVNPVPTYFSNFYIDPNNDLRVYVASMQGTTTESSGIDRSEDGGKTFKPVGGRVHPDFHAMWINPGNSNHMLVGVDGGVYVTRNGGHDWDFLNSMAIGQAHQVGFDMGVPYRVCAGYQDNNSWCSETTTRDTGIGNSHWIKVANGDGFHSQPDPSGNLVYVESQLGQIRRLNLATHEWAGIAPRPKENEPPYRFNWNSPIIVSTHDPGVLYFAAQFLFRSTDRGDNWTTISPDLTTGVDRNTLGILGRLPKDQTISRGFGVDWYPTITRIGESPLDANVLWVGTDDGNVQVTRDRGKTWKNVADRLRDVPKGLYVIGIEPSRIGPGAAYAVIDGHRNNDFRPFVFLTTDYGDTWKPVSGNLPHTSPVYVLREDPRNPEVLFAGTEFGAYVSFDRGARWDLVGGDLPTVRVDDIKIHPREHDLILATHGRSLWLLDDITPLTERSRVGDANLYAFDIRPAISWRRFPQGSDMQGTRPFIGANPPDGALISYYLKQATSGKVDITVFDKDRKVVRQIEGTGHAGVNRVNWDLRYPPLPLERPSGESAGFYDPRFSVADSPTAEPGEYSVQVSVGDMHASKTVRVDDDPLVVISPADRASHHAAVMRAYDLYRTALDGTRTIGSLRTAATSTIKAWQGANAPQVPARTRQNAEAFIERVEAVYALYVGQVLDTASMGAPLTYRPAPLAGRLGGVLFNLKGYTAVPRASDLEKLSELARIEDEARQRLNQLVDVELPALNKEINSAGVPLIQFPPAGGAVYR